MNRFRVSSPTLGTTYVPTLDIVLSLGEGARIEESVDGCWVEVELTREKPKRISQRKDARVKLNTTASGPLLEHFEQKLRERVIGQDRAIEAVLDVYSQYAAGLTEPSRPISNLLFLGPTGTGKTHLAESVAVTLANNPRALIRVDCAEFQHSHEIAKLIGSPPGYLGHRETHPLLSQELLNQYHTEKHKLSFVLFDEIEKASDSLWNLLLGILDKATLTLGDNRKVDFSRTMIFMTSNVGATEMKNAISNALGLVGATKALDSKNLQRTAINAAKRKFTPEFLNRMDGIVVFDPLAQGDLDPIFQLMTKDLEEKVFKSSRCYLEFSKEAKNKIIAEGYSTEYGARNLRRAIFQAVTRPISRIILSGQVNTNDTLHIGLAADGQFTYSKTSQPAIVAA